VKVGTSQEHDARTRLIRRLLEHHAPAPGPEFPCPYLEGRGARHLTILPTPLAPGLYHSLMDLNFRRSGPVFYRTACDGCDACRALRVPVAGFRPSRAHRRCRARNADVALSVGTPQPTAEKHALYRRYLEARHDGQMDGSEHEFAGFLYASPLYTEEFELRIGERLLGVGLVDVEPEALSAVYFYFDPELGSRSPGVLNILCLIDECRRRGVPWLYLGYHVGGARAMEYKTGFRPCELLQPDGSWQSLE